MTPTQATLTAQQFAKLRHRIQVGLAVDSVHRPDGWVLYPLDIAAVLARVGGLQARPQWQWCAYLLTEGSNGNGVVWAIAAEAPCPQPQEVVPRVGWLEAPQPPNAVAPMTAVQGDGAAATYLRASLLQRELAEFGAQWHGCDWADHTVVDPVSLAAWQTAQGTSADPVALLWLQPQASLAMPTCNLAPDGTAEVVFYSVTELELIRVVRHTDRYAAGTLLAQSEATVVAQGGEGYNH